MYVEIDEEGIIMAEKLRVGILGATGMVGQRFITLLADHPWYDIKVLAASSRSAGKTYAEAVGDKWKMDTPMPEFVKDMIVKNIDEIEDVTSQVDFVFSAVNMKKDEIREIEEKYAKTETPVVSNNSAHRWTPDVPMVIPEINPQHYEIIEAQKKRLGTTRIHRRQAELLDPELHPMSCRMERVRTDQGRRVHISGNLRRGQDFQGLAGDGRQHYPVYRR